MTLAKSGNICLHRVFFWIYNLQTGREKGGEKCAWEKIIVSLKALFEAGIEALNPKTANCGFLLELRFAILKRASFFATLYAFGIEVFPSR